MEAGLFPFFLIGIFGNHRDFRCDKTLARHKTLGIGKPLDDQSLYNFAPVYIIILISITVFLANVFLVAKPMHSSDGRSLDNHNVSIFVKFAITFTI